MWWRHRKRDDDRKIAQNLVVRSLTRPSVLEEGKPEGQPLLLQEEVNAQPMAPTLLIGLGETGIEVLRRVKASLEVEMDRDAERVAFVGVALEEEHIGGEVDRWLPLTAEEVLTFAPRYASIERDFPWWRREFVTARDAVRPRGRMLWFWDQTISGERRITTRIDVVRTQLNLSARERLQVLIFGALEAAEFAIAADLALWLRRHILEQHLFNVTLFGIVNDNRRTGLLQMAALQELRRYIAAPRQWMEDDSGVPVVWEKYLFDHAFLFSEKDVATWAGEDAKEVIYTALADISVAFLDSRASEAIRSTLSLVHRQASFYSIGGMRTWLWEPVAWRGASVAEVLRRVIGGRGGEPSVGHRASKRRWVEQFLTRRFVEVEGDSGFNFEMLLQIGRETSPRSKVALPLNFRDGFRWRVLLFLGDLMNEEETSLEEGLDRASQFMDALFSWWANLRRVVKTPTARKWAGALASEADGVLEDIQKIRELLGKWEKVWRRVSQTFGEGEDVHQIAQLAMPRVEVRHYFGDGDGLDEAKSKIARALRERVQWRWQEVKAGEPELVLATLLQQAELWSAKRADEFTACVAEKAAQIMEQQFRHLLGNVSESPPTALEEQLQGQGFIHYGIESRRSRDLFFLPDKVKENLFSQFATRPVAILGWGFPSRMTRIILEGGISPESLGFWQESANRLRPTDSQYVFVQEQRFAALRRRLREMPWSPWFVNLLTAENAIRAMGIGFWYGWVQLEQDPVTEKTSCLLISPADDMARRADVGLQGGWKEAFTNVARARWTGEDYQWKEWVRKLQEGLPAWLEKAHASSWEEREALFRRREPVIEALGQQGEDGQALQAYLLFLREEEQWA